MKKIKTIKVFYKRYYPPPTHPPPLSVQQEPIPNFNVYKNPKMTEAEINKISQSEKKKWILLSFLGSTPETVHNFQYCYINFEKQQKG